MAIKLNFKTKPQGEEIQSSVKTEAENGELEKRPSHIGFSSAFIDGLIFNNLSLVDFVGLTPIIAGGFTVLNGLVLTAATVIVLLIVTPIAAAFGKRIPVKFAPAVYTLIAAAIVALLSLAGYAVLPNVMMSLGLVFPLVAVNGITLNRVRNFAGHSMSATVGDALGKGLGFGIVMFVVSAIREILGYGTFFNLSVPFFENHCTPLMAGVPAGFFIMAVLAWLTRFIGIKTGRISSNADMGGKEK